MALAMSLSALIGAATPLVNRWVAKERNPTYVSNLSAVVGWVASFCTPTWHWQ